MAQARRARKGQVNNPDNPAILEDDPLPVDPPIQEQQPELDVNQPMPPDPPTPIISEIEPSIDLSPECSPSTTNSMPSLSLPSSPMTTRETPPILSNMIFSQSPGPSRKRHLPYSPRRPDRAAKVKANKIETKANIKAAKEEDIWKRNELKERQQIIEDLRSAIVIPSVAVTPKSPCRDSVDILLELEEEIAIVPETPSIVDSPRMPTPTSPPPMLSSPPTEPLLHTEPSPLSREPSPTPIEPSPPPTEPITRKRTRDSVDKLLQEALSSNMLPSTSKRSRFPRTPVIAEDPPPPVNIIQGKEIPAQRIVHRLSNNVKLDYGVDVCNDLVNSNRLVPSEFLDNLTKCTTRCNYCNNKIKHDVVGFAFAKSIVAKCPTRRCKYNRSTKDLSEKHGNFYLTNLRPVYASILNDDGYIGLTREANALSVDHMCKGSYTNHTKYIYKLMDSFYDRNLCKIHQEVKDYYSNAYDMRPDYANGELLDITISLDGSYAHIGHFSRFGVSFVVEFDTGRIIDYNILEKCFECDNHMDYSSNGTCKDKLFHGCAGSMEVENAKRLFSRSKDYGFRYTTYIADADCKVYKKLKDMNIYTVPIIKMECANHFAKRAKKMLEKFGNNYVGETESEEGKGKGKGNGKGKGKGKGKEKGTVTVTNPAEQITNYFTPSVAPTPTHAASAPSMPPTSPMPSPPTSPLPSPPTVPTPTPPTVPTPSPPTVPTPSPPTAPTPSPPTAPTPCCPTVTTKPSKKIIHPRVNKKYIKESRNLTNWLQTSVSASLDVMDPPLAPLDTVDPSSASLDAVGGSSASLDAGDSPTASIDVGDTQPASSGATTRRSARLAAKPTPAVSSVSLDALDSDSASPDALDAPSASKDPVDTAVPVNNTTTGPSNRGKSKYIIKHMFTSQICHQVSQLIRKNVYDHVGIPEKQKSVKAVLYHNLDHPDSTVDEKDHYHQYCGDWCWYKEYLDSGRPLGDYQKTTTKRNGEIVAWTGGYYAKMDKEFPDAFEKLVSILSILAVKNICQDAQKKLPKTTMSLFTQSSGLFVPSIKSIA